jgi:hypothetical protein
MLWRAGAGFRDNLDLLLTQKSVKLVVDEHVNFLRCLTPLFFCRLVGLRPVTSYDTISDAGLWGLLYYTGYLTVESIGNRSMVCVRTIFFRLLLMFRQSEYTLRIPNGEVTSEWHGWVKKYQQAHIPL